MKRLRCRSQKCLYEWNYKGAAPFYTNCPRCFNKVNIAKHTIVEEPINENGQSEKLC